MASFFFRNGIPYYKAALIIIINYLHFSYKLICEIISMYILVIFMYISLLHSCLGRNAGWRSVLDSYLFETI
jgi:hypothetical protein